MAISGTTSDSPVPTLRVGDFGGTGVFTQNNGAVNVGLLGEEPRSTSATKADRAPTTSTAARLLSPVETACSVAPRDLIPQALVCSTSPGACSISLSGSALINGNNFNVVNLGTGTINQTGGTLRVSDGSLYIAGFGNGTYNLYRRHAGGRGQLSARPLQQHLALLDLQPRRLRQTARRSRAIGSALNTSVDWNLVSGTSNKEKATKINTNNLGATLSGNISGVDGGIVKTGGGNLTLSGATRDVGYFNVDEGTTTQSSGTTTTSEFVVGGNYSEKNGEFILNGGTVAISGTTSDSPVPHSTRGRLRGDRRLHTKRRRCECRPDRRRRSEHRQPGRIGNI